MEKYENVVVVVRDLHRNIFVIPIFKFWSFLSSRGGILYKYGGHFRKILGKTQRNFSKS